MDNKIQPETPTIQLTNDVNKTLTFNDNTADAEHQTDASLETDGYGTSPSATADPMKTAAY